MTTATDTNLRTIIDREAFTDALGAVARVVPSRSPKAALTCVLIEAADGVIRLTATDLEVAMRREVRTCEVQEDGAVLVPAERCFGVVRRLTGPTVTLEQKGDKLTITGDQSRADIFAMSVGDFPPVATHEADHEVSLDGGELVKMLSATIPAMAKDNTRYAINGVYLVSERGKLNAVVTDGHHLHLIGSAVKCPEGFHPLIPGKAANLLAGLCGDGEVTLGVGSGRIHATGDGWKLWSNLVEGNFPPYLDIIPKSQDKKASVDAEAFQSALAFATTMTNEESKGVRMAFSKDGLKLSSRAPEMGEADVTVSLASYTGEPLEIAFNPAYIAAAVKAAGVVQVDIELAAANKPGLIRGDRFVAVVMPTNLQ